MSALVGAAERDAGESLEWPVERARAVACRGSLPRGAVCLESSLTALPGRVCVGTFVLTEQTLSQSPGFAAVGSTTVGQAVAASSSPRVNTMRRAAAHGPPGIYLDHASGSGG
jgi:hypothetical protein